MTTHVGRNDPCPCGSGRKYKHCCEGKLQVAARMRRGGPWLYVGLALAAVAIVGVVFVVRGQNRATTTVAQPAPGASGMANTLPGSPVGGPGTRQVSSNTDGPPAAPWTYDPATNRHFDPTHNHWHDGPAPPLDKRGASGASPTPGGTPTPTFTVNPTAGTPAPSAGPTPAPWTYDAAKNQHWDPGHGHWHPGKPPEGRK